MEDVCRQVRVRACGVRACVEVKVQSSQELLGLTCTCNCGGPAERARHWKATLGKVKGSPPNLP